MKISFAKDKQTEIVDTDELRTCEEYTTLLRRVGKSMFEISAAIDEAKHKKRTEKIAIPADQWKEMNEARLTRIKEWKLLAKHIIFMWPKEINFTANKMLMLLSDRNPKLYQELLEEAKEDPTDISVRTVK